MGKIKFGSKLYEYAGYGDSDCPICGKSFDYEYDKAIHITPRIYCFDSFTFNVFVRCKNCGKRYVFTDGN